MADPPGRRRHRIAVSLLAVLALGLLGWAVATDLQAHARDRHEHAALAEARHVRSLTSAALATTSADLGQATTHLGALRASVGRVVGQLSTTDAALSGTRADAYLQGVNIETRQTCLRGVESSFQQIAQHDNTQAAQDISGVSGACLSLTGQTNGGLVFPFDFPDPDVLQVGGTYFAYATNSVAGNIQIIESTDHAHWTAVGNALPKLPAWAAPNNTWAPAVAVIGGAYVMYYAAKVAKPGGGEECISVASATQPQGPFLDTSTAPLECQPTLDGSLDPSPFVDVTGKVYLQWKSNGGAQPATIWSEQLDPAGTAFAPNATPAKLLVPDQPWEGTVVEAPDMVVSGGRYFLFYSGNNWKTASYAVGAATCTGPLGPCTKTLSAPILSNDSGMEGPGGESVFQDTTGAYWVAFHAWLAGAVGYPNSRGLYVRQLNLSGPTPVVEPAT